ncbi:UBP1 [Candida margitis]|uniref:UBP1 n=1 Tax=Candida margitis TaxID=1775924 RepID=UPI002226390C|nr:UBP1 [Candida margitis]KAI5969794.1 UBP1 [Candida margitis]
MFISTPTRLLLILLLNFVVINELVKLSLFKSNKVLATASTSLLIFLSLYYLSTSVFNLNLTDSKTTSSSETWQKYIPFNIPQLLHKAMNSSSRFGRTGINRFNRRKSKEQKFAIANGGEVGGISNDGNTCFMNSVIQSFASSRQFMKFIDSYLYSEIEIDTNGQGEKICMKSNQPKPELPFTTALKKLLDSVNGKYGSRGKEFSTKPLLNKMPNGPRQNFFSGYNQEDAQEFYQLIMNILEKEFKKISQSRLPTPEPEGENKEEHKFQDARNLKEIISGCNKLGKLGVVYVPAAQVDPNLADAEHKVMPLELITPVDGISCERIGCLTCGEVGGIRYAVTSGLSLNLPQNQSYYSSFKLSQLLNEWITPEIIDDVNCNRCGLLQTQKFLLGTIDELEKKENDNTKLIVQIKTRLQAIELELAKHQVTDEAFEKLTVKKQIKKSRKSKQIFLDRPPPLLSIHINRSQFDPKTYMVVKNPNNVTFPAVLDLSPYIVEPNQINMDARLPFRKQDEHLKYPNGDMDDVSISGGDRFGKGDSESLSPPSTSAETSVPSDGLVSPNGTAVTTAEQQPNPKLLYNLKAVIVHFGTHNYGHYICYRKLRGTWWRISDESIYVVTEAEVLGGQGTFMLFYEYNDGYVEVLQDVSDDEEEETNGTINGGVVNQTQPVSSPEEGAKESDSDSGIDSDEEVSGSDNSDSKSAEPTLGNIVETEHHEDVGKLTTSAASLSSDVSMRDDDEDDGSKDDQGFNVAEAQVHL